MVERALQRITRELSFAQPPERYAALYAAQQALAWVNDPANFKSPFDTVVAGLADKPLFSPTPAPAKD